MNAIIFLFQTDQRRRNKTDSPPTTIKRDSETEGFLGEMSAGLPTVCHVREGGPGGPCLGNFLLSKNCYSKNNIICILNIVNYTRKVMLW